MENSYRPNDIENRGNMLYVLSNKEDVGRFSIAE